MPDCSLFFLPFGLMMSFTKLYESLCQFSIIAVTLKKHLAILKSPRNEVGGFIDFRRVPSTVLSSFLQPSSYANRPFFKTCD